MYANTQKVVTYTFHKSQKPGADTPPSKYHITHTVVTPKTAPANTSTHTPPPGASVELFPHTSSIHTRSSSNRGFYAGMPPLLPDHVFVIVGRPGTLTLIFGGAIDRVPGLASWAGRFRGRVWMVIFGVVDVWELGGMEFKRGSIMV
jgi:hypothetical protein